MRAPRHADEARAVAAQVLGRLTDPEAVEAGTGYPDLPAGPGADADDLWVALSLTNGFPAVSVAFSGATERHPAHVAHAHAHLRRSLAAVADGGHPPGGLYATTSAAAYALSIAHRATGGYRDALARLDVYHRELVRRALPRVPAEPVASNAEFEVIRGMSGVGRHLLARGESAAEETRAVLEYLTAMALGGVTLRGHAVPRWWTWAAPRAGQEAELPDGHLNLGLSHGVSGPLALLSLAWRSGVAVDGQREAVEAVVGLLETWAVPDGEGLRWPPYLTLDDWAAGPGSPVPPWQRPSWCYGSPGIARAVQLAALALDRPDWHELARRALLPLLDRPVSAWGLEDAGLCHGTGGALHVLGLLREHIDDERLDAVVDELAALTIGHFREEHRFGFRTSVMNAPEGADLPGFLDGAAGTALALDAYAHGGRAHADWDMALLVD
ncbi:lanthionine synthetase C family protein [Streptomyces sp. CA-181903]|uniref:lanthionine synthetase C family protein n=1 Tax=Streptomyces sp. CA-181903 TaxID=3240055 RepID=UPI003D94F8F7